MTNNEINQLILSFYPERENDYQERKRTVNDGEEPNPIELVLYSLAPKLKIRLIRNNETRIKKERDKLEHLFALNNKEVNDILHPLSTYLKQEGLFEKAEPYFLPLTKKNRSD